MIFELSFIFSASSNTHCLLWIFFNSSTFSNVSASAYPLNLRFPFSRFAKPIQIESVTKGKSSPLTGWKIVSVEQHGYNYQYKIQYFRFIFEISVGVECFTNLELLQKKQFIRWLLLKNRLSARRNREEFPYQLFHWQPLLLLETIKEPLIALFFSSSTARVYCVI